MKDVHARIWELRHLKVDVGAHGGEELWSGRGVSRPMEERGRGEGEEE